MQYGGGKCSLCGAQGTNKSSCPKNPDSINVNPGKHQNVNEYTIELSDPVSGDVVHAYMVTYNEMLGYSALRTQYADDNPSVDIDYYYGEAETIISFDPKNTLNYVYVSSDDETKFMEDYSDMIDIIMDDMPGSEEMAEKFLKKYNYVVSFKAIDREAPYEREYPTLLFMPRYDKDILAEFLHGSYMAFNSLDSMYVYIDLGSYNVFKINHTDQELKMII